MRMDTLAIVQISLLVGIVVVLCLMGIVMIYRVYCSHRGAKDNIGDKNRGRVSLSIFGIVLRRK